MSAEADPPMAGNGGSSLVFDRVQDEQGQLHGTRQALFPALAEQLGRPVASFFTSFRFPVMIEDSDADMLEGVLQQLDLSSGLALFISSPGGDGLAAERIINLCRAYSGTGEYWAIVPGKAKSAATMVCFGASKIIMGATSELGPVDPQVIEEQRAFSAFNVVQSYRDLFQRAVQEQGNLQPYLQQLANYDEREIAELDQLLDLSRDISVRVLKSGMMADTDEEEIARRIAMFLTPEQTKTHGRPIYRDEAEGCGLTIEQVPVGADVWKTAYELYVRTNNLVMTTVTKCVESAEHSYSATP